jgi:hypothetical protein
VELALCSRGTTLGKGTLRMYPSWSVVPTTVLQRLCITLRRQAIALTYYFEAAGSRRPGGIMVLGAACVVCCVVHEVFFYVCMMSCAACVVWCCVRSDVG